METCHDICNGQDFTSINNVIQMNLLGLTVKNKKAVTMTYTTSYLLNNHFLVRT